MRNTLYTRLFNKYQTYISKPRFLKFTFHLIFPLLWKEEHSKNLKNFNSICLLIISFFSRKFLTEKSCVYDFFSLFRNGSFVNESTSVFKTRFDISCDFKMRKLSTGLSFCVGEEKTSEANVHVPRIDFALVQWGSWPTEVDRREINGKPSVSLWESVLSVEWGVSVREHVNISPRYAILRSQHKAI